MDNRPKDEMTLLAHTRNALLWGTAIGAANAYVVTHDVPLYLILLVIGPILAIIVLQNVAVQKLDGRNRRESLY